MVPRRRCEQDFEIAKRERTSRIKCVRTDEREDDVGRAWRKVVSAWAGLVDGRKDVFRPMITNQQWNSVSSSGYLPAEDKSIDSVGANSRPKDCHHDSSNALSMGILTNSRSVYFETTSSAWRYWFLY